MFPFTLQHLQILKAVASTKSFTKAGNFLHLSQPCISKNIKILEKNLNILLINRKSNKIFLTENGQIFLNYSERILALCEESYQSLVDSQNNEKRNLKIGASRIVGTYLLPKLLPSFTENHPQINLKIQVNSTKVIIKNIINKAIDLGIIGGKIPNKLKKYLLIKHFVKDKLCLIAGKLHPISSKTILTKEDLYYLDYISLKSNLTTRKFIDNLLIQNQIQVKQLKIMMEFNSLEEIKTAVSLGTNVAFVPLSTIEKELELKTIKIINIENVNITRLLSIITSHHSYEEKIIEFFSTEFFKLKDKSKKIDGLKKKLV